MPKHISQLDKERIEELVKLGKSDAEIVQILGWKHKTAQRSVANERRIRGLKPGLSLTPTTPKTMDEMTRDERFLYIQSRLKTTPRFKIIFTSFSKEEIEFFTDEYFNVLKSTDTLNEAEEQALFSAVIEYVLAYRSLNIKSIEEDLYTKSVKGEIEDDEPTYRRYVDDRYQKEYESHMKQYQGFMKDLKMSRDQRLKDIKSERKSLVDLVTALSVKEAQVDAASEIERLSKLRDEELKRLLDNGYIVGKFDD